VITCTPGQFAVRADFYHQLAQLTSAGLGIVQTLQQMERHPPALSYRTPIRRLLEYISQGYTMTESLIQLGRWLPQFDLALLHAGEQSGRLDQCYRLLSDYYTGRAALARQLLMDLAYPAFLFHFAIFILPFAQFFISGNLSRYLLQTFGILIPLYIVVFLMILAAQSRHGETWRSLVEEVLHRVPVLGIARRELAFSRFATALEALISAGVTIIEAWQLAAAASGSPALRQLVSNWRAPMQEGNTPGELIAATRFFPTLFSGQYQTAEISGQLDDALRRLARYYLEEGTRKLRAVAQWTPKIIYLMVVLGIAYFIVQFWTKFYGSGSPLSEILKGF
jgi:type II secretory pathway component PulF